MMTGTRFLSWLVGVFVSLALPFLLVMASLRLLLSYEFLRFEYQRAGFPADFYGFSTADRLEYGMPAIEYLFSAEGVDTLAGLRLPHEKCWRLTESAADCPLFTGRELRHLEDAKRVLSLAFWAATGCLVSLGCFMLATLWPSGSAHWRARLGSEIRRGMKRGAFLTLGMNLALATAAAAAWDLAFEVFHGIFFAAGTWRFPFSDSLIRLYPEQLFVDAAIALAGFVALGGLVMLGLVEIWRRLAASL